MPENTQVPGAVLARAFENVCVFHILDGLRDGLSHFSDRSRAAVIYAIGHGDRPRIYDPQDLMRGHQPKLKEFYLESLDWRGRPSESDEVELLEAPHYENLQLAGLIALGGRSRHVAYQMWFTEQHLQMCSVGPTQRWLEHAVRLFSQNYAVKSVLTLESAGFLLQQCAVHAVRDHIVDERIRIRGMDTNLRVYPILDAVLGVSKTLEEGAWPRGRLVFVEPSEISGLPFLARFPDNERPSIQNFKHVRKLLQAVEFSPRQLVSDGRSLVGVSRDLVPGSAIVADFRGGHGFLFLGGTPVCSFSDGSFHSSTRRANLVHLEEALLETGLTHEDQHRLMQIVTRIVHAAGERKHGCAVVIDLGGRGLSMSGQYLDRPLDLRADENLDLALSLSKVDGALHLRSDLRLHGFACLMDGKAAPGEDRARGARYNSAVRFTSGHEEVIVVTVSSDRPVSVIQGGVNLTAICEWLPFYGCPSPPCIEDWVRDGQG